MYSKDPESALAEACGIIEAHYEEGSIPETTMERMNDVLRESGYGELTTTIRKT